MIKVGVAGRFKLEAFNEETGERRELVPWFDNLILDQGLNILGTQGLQYFCHVGTGSSTPAVTDTALASKLAHTTTTASTTSGVSGAAPHYGWTRVVYRFAAGAAAGNLTELGVGYSGTALFSRTLIKDGSGNPTTITVLPSEVLDVTYELRVYAPAGDTPHSTTISGVTYTGVIRAAQVTTATSWRPSSVFSADPQAPNAAGTGYSAKVYNGAIGAETATPSGTSTGIPDAAPAAYASNSLQRTGTTTCGLTQGNVAGGITAMLVPTTLGAYQISFSPAIPKDATKVLTLGLTLSWARMVI